MESKRRVRDGISFVLLFIIGDFSTAVSGQSLDCTNDYEALMFCHIEALNCTGYSLTLRSNDVDWKADCNFTQSDVGRCCCSFHDMILILGETHTATVWKGGKTMESKIFNVTTSLKPKTPTITSVKESNGNFVIRWKTNYAKGFNQSLSANVTYHKKGETEMVPAFIKPTTVDGLNVYEILGQRLEPRTTYAVSVKSYSNLSDKYSDSSAEWEFTTPVSPFVLPLAIIISLSIAAAFISGAIYVCIVKFKTKCWDKIAKSPNPKLPDLFPSKQEVLKPVHPIISSVFVEPLDPDEPWSKELLRETSSGSLQQSSGISTGLSHLSDANTETDIIACVQDALGKAFPGISPVSPLITNPLSDMNKHSTLLSSAYNPCDVPTNDTRSGLSCFDNRTYNPILQNPIITDSSEMPCDPAYGPSPGDSVTCVDQQAPVCLPVNLQPVVLSIMPADMSDQCNADSGGFSYAEDSSLSSVSNGDPESGAEAGCESGAMKLHENTEVPTVSDENPCYGCMPAGSNSFPLVDNDYQAIQNLSEQPEILISERSGEKQEHLNKYPEEPFTKVPQSFSSPVAPGLMNNVQGEECLSELQRPFLSLTPADQSMPLITSSGYQSV
ncbi:uncharacterized protein LOC131993901 [Centropristis striata]|uniref:uncharacterized protein LOC131993901 n=1 Tax=Centropristis striata TaxID=184440 RepID=UPI0027DFE6F7|nr:uncharacterized protein LOC131993901 [Centropristis striata]